MMRKRCKYCGISRVRITDGEKRKNRSYVYRDENGSPWRQAKCPACKKADDVQRIRDHGGKHVDDFASGNIYEGRKAEKTAAAWLRKQGFRNVKLNEGKGPDIKARRYGREFTFEVKKAVKQSANTGLYVNAVAGTRMQDDFIIYVHGEVCIMRSMHEHLLEASQSKYYYLTVTKMFKRTELPS